MRDEVARSPQNEAVSDKDREFYETHGTYDRYEITEEDCYDELGFCFPSWRKWLILSIVFTVQVSMNFNTSLYSNAVPGISEEFGVSAQAGRLGAAIFLITYAFGCELWAVRIQVISSLHRSDQHSPGVKNSDDGPSSSSVCFS